MIIIISHTVQKPGIPYKNFIKLSYIIAVNFLFWQTFKHISRKAPELGQEQDSQSRRNRKPRIEVSVNRKFVIIFCALLRI